MSSLRVAVADDEPLAKERLARLLKECGCEVVAELDHAKALMDWLREGGEVDALFLDIQMPGGSGLELLAELEKAPPVVFVTAFQEHAVRAFELVAFDYIVKPVFKDRLEKTLARLKASPLDRGRVDESATPTHPQKFPVKAGGGHVFLEFKRVTHFEVEDEIVWVWSAGRRFRAPWSSLSEVESIFTGAGLIRIQRNLLLRPEAVIGHRTLGGGRALVRVAEGIELEVSRTTTARLREILGIIEPR
jgi:DNA-binding LytR/AlgR family response regulator